jgi:hypothetical protein
MELSDVDLRRQMVLGCLGAARALSPQGVDAVSSTSPQSGPPSSPVRCCRERDDYHTCRYDAMKSLNAACTLLGSQLS